jgi:S-formylglutathione hydrolase FrmB
MTDSRLAEGFSLLDGWLPLTVQVVAFVLLALAIGRRSGRWSLRWLIAGAVTGAVLAALTHWYIQHHALAGKAAPFWLWVWIVLSVVAVVVLFAGWRAAGRVQRLSSILALPLCVLCVVMTVNVWTGYLPTVSSAWDRRPGASGEEIDLTSLRAMQDEGVRPETGTIVAVDIPDGASGFKHRREYVYLPPAWFDTNPAPELPAVMMIGGEFGDPRDWMSVGAKDALDDFAADHDGNAPIVVFVDHSGTFLNDTECVNGKRGNAADHLMKDVVPFVTSNFRVSSEPGRWGIVGWSAGGTCAVTLAVKYSDMFSAFVDIDGQASPNAGTREQTIQRLFGGNADAWASFDPATVMAAHGPYQNVSAWFGVSEPTTPVYRPGASGAPGTVDVPVPDPSDPGNVTGTAQYMCALASSYGIGCSVVPGPGDHDFTGSAAMLPTALPWLAGKLGTPSVPAIPLPGA